MVILSFRRACSSHLPHGVFEHLEHSGIQVPANDLLCGIAVVEEIFPRKEHPITSTYGSAFRKCAVRKGLEDGNVCAPQGAHGHANGLVVLGAEVQLSSGQCRKELSISIAETVSAIEMLSSDRKSTLQN